MNRDKHENFLEFPTASTKSNFIVTLAHLRFRCVVLIAHKKNTHTVFPPHGSLSIYKHQQLTSFVRFVSFGAVRIRQNFLIKMKVAIIGAGAAGLCAMKHAVAFGCDVIAFEKSEQIGGTWVYSDDTGSDKFGNAIHSSMYKGLHTNLPKELMSFPDLLFPRNELSFVPAEDVNQYLNLYADRFMLRQRVKLEHQVVRVRPLLDNTWEVMVKNLAQDSLNVHTFDFVFVCNGHFSTPSFPHYREGKPFKGREIHSHDYRRPETFRGRNVLVIGGGPSGMDITQEIAKCAEKVFWSFVAVNF
jgi:dimethylaniline monooxygenase (N-oxide forming)